MINLKHKKVINKVVWIWSSFFNQGLFDDTPEELLYYLDRGYTVKDYSATTYKEGSCPGYMFILEKTID